MTDVEPLDGPVYSGAITEIVPWAGNAQAGWVADVYGVGFTPSTTWSIPGLSNLSDSTPDATYLSPTHFRVTIGYFPPNHTASGTLYCSNPVGHVSLRWASAPYIRSITPPNGPPLGGTNVRLYGMFEGANRVTFDGSPVDFDNPDVFDIYVVAPGGAPGTARIEVQCYESMLAAGDYQYDAPYVGFPGTYPIPEGRGLWRLTLHDRAYAAGLSPTSDLFIAEITNARSVKLDQVLNDSATLSFSINGLSPSAPLIKELATDVMAWRWDDRTGQDIPLFRGVVAQSQDTLSEQADTVTFTCHSYDAMLQRRLLTKGLNYAATDQDNIAAGLLQAAKVVSTSGNVSLSPGSYLPMELQRVDPAGYLRGLSGTLRDRQYPGQQDLSEALTNLAAVEGGFDFDVVPGYQISPSWHDDQLRIFFPHQGIPRPDVILEYGSTVSALSRTVNSGDYANYVRALGNSGDSDPNAPQFWKEAVGDDANAVTRAKQGLWMKGENNSDVSVAQTLQDLAGGSLKQASLLEPSYSLTLRPGFYKWGSPRMGEAVRLIVQAGRLSVDTTVRVVGISYDVGDDGGENVGIQVGRTDTTFADLLMGASRDLNALARR